MGFFLLYMATAIPRVYTGELGRDARMGITSDINENISVYDPSIHLMKTAVLISGQLRTFGKCYPTQRFQIFRHYEPDLHFFCSLSGEGGASAAGYILRQDYQNVHVESYEDPTDLPVIPVESGQFAPYANATSHEKLMLQHWGNKKVWDFFCASADKESFDVIIRIRPDLWIHRFQQQVGRFLYPPANVAFCPWWGKFGGVNDRLAVMGCTAASHYFNVYPNIHTLMDMGCPFHPESLVAETMRIGGVHVENNLMTEFSTMRMDGSQRWAEIVMSDIAELIASK